MSLKRRAFVHSLAAAVGGSWLSLAQAQHEGHEGHSMPSLKKEPAPDPHANHRMSPEKTPQTPLHENAGLLAESALPQHQALAPLPRLANQSKRPGEFVATLHAKPVTLSLAPGLSTHFWAYNEQVPGPLIEVFEGDTVKITFKNDLPQASTIHWHGLPVPADQDGNPQDEVASGASRTYNFTLPDNCAGTYWYHPHGHSTIPEQVFRGLAGAFIVKSKKDPLDAIPAQNWLISDLKLAADASIAPNSMLDWMNGREGQFVLINGGYRPTITLNTTTRVRVWNACSARYLNLSIPNADVYLVGTDGGLIAQPFKVKELLLSPAERAELLVVPRTTGKADLLALSYDRGKMGGAPTEPTRTLASLVMKPSELPKLTTPLRRLPEYASVQAHKKLEYTEIMEMSDGKHQMDFLINGKKHDMQRIDLLSKVGQVEEWLIFNNSHMDHNFHLHGMPFMVIDFELKGAKRLPDVVGLKDTINLKPYETARIKTRQLQKGLRMYHCHILEHEGLGMMGQLEVV